jgi:hypothetical protein
VTRLRRRLRRSAVVLAAIAVAVTGCTAGEQPEEPRASAPAQAAGPSLPPLAGPSEAAVVAGLPDGQASGEVAIAYSGLGELRSDFAGSCTRDGDTTTVRGSADEAEVVLVFAPSGAQVTVTDVGLESTSSVAAGDLQVHGNHLSMSAPLLEDGQLVGSVELVVVCATG